MPFMFPKRTKTFQARSPTLPWDSDSTPTWFVHMGDVHLSKMRKSYDYVSGVLDWCLGKFKPDRVIICGDLTDNQGMEKVRPYRRQLKDDWLLYEELLRTHGLTKENLIQTLGNHDVYALASYSERNNFGQRYFGNLSQFHMSTSFYKHENTMYKFIVLNQYEFPTGPICFLQWSFVTPKVKQELEAELNKDDCDVAIIVSHNPALRYHKLSTFASIIDHSPKLRLMLSGHWHPMRGSILHFGDTIEAVSPPLFKKPRIGLITFDNGRYGYTMIDKDQDVNAVMTHPVPDAFATSFNLFDEQITEIRAIGFSERKLLLAVTGSINGELVRVKRLKPGVYLYSLPVKLSPGKYRLVKVGDWSGTVEFTIGQEVKPFYEKPYMNRSSYGWTIVFLLMYIPALLLSIPKLSLFVCDSPSVLTLPLRSFGYVKARLSALPPVFQRSLCVSTILCGVFPVSFFDVEGLLCAFHVAGNFFGFHYRYHYLGAKYGLTYLMGMFYPIVNIINGIHSYRQNLLLPIIDVTFLLYGFAKYLYDFMWLFDMFGPAYATTSILMTVVPVLMYGNLIFLVYQTCTHRPTEDTAALKEAALYPV